MSEATYIFQKVRDAARIEEVVGEHVSLRPAGRELVGLCPFHDDRRPSMHVVPHKQIYWCFVCGAGGDVFRFVQNYHKMSAGEALRFLAQKYGVKLPEFRSESPGAKQAASLREKTFAANQWAAKIFKENLRNSSGRTALKYLLQRGLTDKTIEEFELGFAPDGWTHLVSAAVRDGVSSQLLIGSGLLKERSDGSPFDAFRNRVIFPIQDLGGRIIGFGGRILPGSNTTVETPEAKAEAEQEGPKYLNTPETTLFSKRETLYALDKSRQTIMKFECAIVVEGYMDVIGCHQAGVGNVVATLGTALTQEHVKLLRRFTNKLVLVFDSDEAGRRAADRAIELLLKYPVDVHIASVPDGKDPCDYCMTHGGEAFSELIANAPDALEFKWQLLIGTFNKSESLAQKQEAATAMLRLMAPVVMLTQSIDVVAILLGRDSGWNVQRRDGGGIPARETIRLYRRHTVLGVVLGGVAWLVSPYLALWMLPVVLGLALAIPLALWTGRRSSLLRTPEETTPPAVVARAAALQQEWMALPIPGVTGLLQDHSLLRAHRAMLPPARRPRVDPIDVTLLTAQVKVDEAEALDEALAVLSPAELAMALGNAGTLERLCALR